MSVTRYSKQREAIRTYLQSTKEHPTADVIYEHIQQSFPNISLGTVYRNLNFLVERGDALRIDFGNGVDHFDGNTSFHNHFFCKNCGRIIDLEMDPIDHIDRIANAGFNGSIQGHSIYFYGICEKCMASQKKEK